MTVEKHRMTALEMTMLAHIDQLDHKLTMFAQAVSMSMPTAPLSHFTSQNGGYQYGQQPGQNAPASITSLMPGHMPLSGLAVIAGRGPRFVAKYNLARTDAERQELLDSLPKLTSAYQLHNQSLFREHRRPMGGANWADREAQEVRDYIDSVKDEPIFEIRNHQELMKQMGLTDYNWPLDENDRVNVGTTIGRHKTKIGQWHNSDVPTYVFTVPLKAKNSAGWAVYRISQTNSNNAVIWTSQIDGAIRWSEHELCWVYLESGESLTAKEVYESDLALAQLLRIPEWVSPIDAEWRELLERFFQTVFFPILIKYSNDKPRAITLAVPGVLKFVAATSGSYWGSWEIRGYYDDANLNDIDGKQPSHFQLWHDFNPENDKPANLQSGSATNVPPRHRAYLKEKLEQFLQNEVPFVEVIGNSISENFSLAFKAQPSTP